MSSKEIKNHYGLFAENVRKAPVIHTSHGRQTMVTISIEKAKEMKLLKDEVLIKNPLSREEKLEQLKIFNEMVERQNIKPLSVEEIMMRSREFRDN